MLTGEQFLRLKLLRFPLIVGVVFFHALFSYFGSEIEVSQQYPLMNFVMGLFYHGLGRIATPLSYVISGYLLFFGFNYTHQNYFLKIKTRVNTLFIPFLIWNLWGFTLVMALGLFEKNPTAKNFNVVDIVSTILGIGRSPVSYQFWFVRDLIVLVLMGPVIFQFCKKYSRIYLSSLFIVWFFDLLPMPNRSVGACLFFSVGCYLGSQKRDIFHCDRFGWKVLIIYLVLITSTILLNNTIFYSALYKVSMILGIMSWLYLSKIFLRYSKFQNDLIYLGSASFFVFAAHEPLLGYVNRAANKIIQPQQAELILVLYFLIPVFVIATLVITYQVFSRLFPKFSNIVNGGR